MAVAAPHASDDEMDDSWADGLSRAVPLLPATGAPARGLELVEFGGAAEGAARAGPGAAAAAELARGAGGAAAAAREGGAGALPAAGGALWTPPQGARVRAVAGPMAGRSGRVRCSGTASAHVYFDQVGRGGRAKGKCQSVTMKLEDLVLEG